MRILVVGGGGREHALAWKLAQNPTVDKLFALPGNAGIAEVAECFDAATTDAETIANLAEDLGIDLVVVGPEVPLVAGLADELSERGVPVFGPSKAAARIEGSKAWAKEILARSGAPTARAEAFQDPTAAVGYLDRLEPPYVVKADGLAAGKGVVVAPDRKAAIEAIENALLHDAFGAAGTTVVIEEFLHGEELSVFCLTDGRTVLPLAEAQDFKRAYDDDQGPNTGGMGAFSPVKHLPKNTVRRAVKEIFEPVVATLEAEGARYVGCLYGGLMITAEGPKVFEFNCRFGDPEAQALMPRLASDLAELLLACVEGNLRDYKPIWRPESCVSVVLASDGYPEVSKTGFPITGIDAAQEDPNVTVFHAGTKEGPVTAGGRVLSVSALGSSLHDARLHAYQAAEKINFQGKTYRRDIAARAAEREGGNG